MRENEDVLLVPENLQRFSPFLETGDEGVQVTVSSPEEEIEENREGGDYREEAFDIHQTNLNRDEGFDREMPVLDNLSGREITDSFESRKKSFEVDPSPPHKEEVELLEEFDNELDFILAGELLGEAALHEEAPARNIYGEEGGGRLSIKKDPPPSEIVHTDSFRKIPVHRSTKASWEAMIAAARAAGHKHPLLLPTSGYRSTAQQAELWKKALKKYGNETEARKWVAKPGGSAHHSGRALDLYLGIRNNKESAASQRRTAVYQWLRNNASSFGFYPYEREPWHWEHNPLPGNRLPENIESGPSVSVDTSEIAKAVRLNRKYAKETSWINYYSQINDLLLKTIGRENLSLGEEAFAEAVAVWQKKNGFTGKQADGIIGPVTWKKMRQQLSLPPNRQ